MEMLLSYTLLNSAELIPKKNKKKIVVTKYRCQPV